MKAPCAGMQGKMLPSVTTEDNGDVLTVVDGEWKKASGGEGGGASLFVVNVGLTLDETTGAVVVDSVDKTLPEVREAYTNGSDIKAKVTSTVDSGVLVMPLFSIDMADGQDSTGAQFVLFMPTFLNAAIVEILGYNFSMFPNGNSFESGTASFE